MEPNTRLLVPCFASWLERQRTAWFFPVMAISSLQKQEGELPPLTKLHLPPPPLLPCSPWLSAPPATLAELRSPSERAQQPQPPQPVPQFGVPQPLQPRPQAGPQPQWGVPQPLQAQGGMQPDQLMVHALTTMGFPSRHAAHALIATKNAGGADWLLWIRGHTHVWFRWVWLCW